MPKVEPLRRDYARVTTVTADDPAAAPSRYAGGARQHHIQVVVSRPTFYENILYLRKTIAPSKICVVLKSNAYGHGLAALAPVAVAAGADYLGVCTNPEAAAIRQMGIDVPLFRLRMGLPEELDESAAELDMDEQVGTLGTGRVSGDAGQEAAAQDSGPRQHRHRHGTERFLCRADRFDPQSVRPAGFENPRGLHPLRQIRRRRSGTDHTKLGCVRALVRAVGRRAARRRADPHAQQRGDGAAGRQAATPGACRRRLLWRAHVARLR